MLSRVFATVAGLLLVWPVPHYFATKALVSDPWKNFGLAMYATYFEVGVGVRVRDPGRDWRELPEDEASNRLIGEFVERRRTRGKLHRPDRLAQALSTLTPEREMQILVTTRSLDGRAGVMREIDRERYTFLF